MSNKLHVAMIDSDLVTVFMAGPNEDHLLRRTLSAKMDLHWDNPVAYQGTASDALGDTHAGALIFDNTEDARFFLAGDVAGIENQARDFILSWADRHGREAPGGDLSDMAEAIGAKYRMGYLRLAEKLIKTALEARHGSRCKPVHEIPLDEFLGGKDVIPDTKLPPFLKERVDRHARDWEMISQAIIDEESPLGRKIRATAERHEGLYQPDRDLWFAEVDGCITMLDGELNLIGTVRNGTPYVPPHLRGNGYGAELFLGAYVLFENPFNPVIYSGSGHANRMSAHRRAVSWALQNDIEVPDAVLETYRDKLPEAAARLEGYRVREPEADLTESGPGGP